GEKKSGTAEETPPCRERETTLSEPESATEFHGACAVVVGDGSEVAVMRSGVDALELRVVEGVEGLKAKFEPRAHAGGERNRLREREVPVKDPGPPHRILARRTEALVRPALPGSGRIGEGADREPGPHLLRVADLGDEIGTVGEAAAETDDVAARIGDKRG